MTVGTDLADEVTLNETHGIVDPVLTPVQIHHATSTGGGADLIDILAEMVPLAGGKGGSRADLIARFPFSGEFKRGRIESGPLFNYAGETFNTCIAKSWRKGHWQYTVFLREHVGTSTYRKRDGSRGQRWTWNYHMYQSFLSVGQAYDLFERLCQAQRNEQELDDPYHTPFMSGPETPWDPHALADMAVAQEQRDTSRLTHEREWVEPDEWTVINLDAAPQ